MLVLSPTAGWRRQIVYRIRENSQLPEWPFCGQFSGHFCGPGLPQFVVALHHNIWEVTERLFVAGGAIVRCGQRTQHLSSHREDICSLQLPQFIVAEDHNNWEVTVARISGHTSILGSALTDSRVTLILTLLFYAERVSVSVITLILTLLKNAE